MVLLALPLTDSTSNWTIATNFIPLDAHFWSSGSPCAVSYSPPCQKGTYSIITSASCFACDGTVFSSPSFRTTLTSILLTEKLAIL